MITAAKGAEEGAAERGEGGEREGGGGGGERRGVKKGEMGKHFI